jgi:hypothetical protein
MGFHCPVCGEEFPDTTSDLRFQRHVNRCLDGEPDIEDHTPNFLAVGNGRQHPSLAPNPDSYVSLAGSSLTDTPTVTTTSPQQQQRAGGTSGDHISAGEAAFGGGVQPPHLAHVESSSLDYYAAIEENCEFICGLCPDFPRALVEEVLISNGNRKDLAMSTLFELKDQSEAATADGSAGGTFHHLWGGDKSTSSNRHHHHSYHVTRSNLQHLGDTVAVTSAVPILPRGPQHSNVELVIYDLQPDSTVAKKVGLGAYHTGIVMYGHEFSFGGSRNMKRDAGRSGIWATRNLYQTAAVIKKRMTIGVTYVTIKELQGTLREWGKTEWRVDDYHLLSKNCNHFADALLQWLSSKSVPLYLPLTVVEPATPQLSTTTTGRTPVSPQPRSGHESGGTYLGLPSGVSPLPKFPIPSASTPTTTSAQLLPSSSGATAAASPAVAGESPIMGPPSFPLSPEQAKRVQELFRLPSWVNRAAAVGNAVIPDFLFKKIVEALMPPVPEDDQEATPLS